jgi:hypothetical protein
MNKETDLSSEWLQAWTLRLWAKGKEKKALGEKMSDIEEQLFEEADERLDEYFKEKKENVIYKAEG